ncbi:hypothetical protein BDP27DRAFT_1366228 [Rhodocollybia butyracea]|uniref:CxC2-like cysteine cluster KDZ transposase-associated domain-containing protein n=1 Tax=Rhodocollybia butyracea TaxID=206335 RepID=A0A9P5U4G1_9AGAR|nr:hypothetical protein BDP27DRAFT_1366228 [Rhodocollybia butyracea]
MYFDYNFEDNNEDIRARSALVEALSPIYLSATHSEAFVNEITKIWTRRFPEDRLTGRKPFDERSERVKAEDIDSGEPNDPELSLTRTMEALYMEGVQLVCGYTVNSRPLYGRAVETSDRYFVNNSTLYDAIEQAIMRVHNQFAGRIRKASSDWKAELDLVALHWDAQWKMPEGWRKLNGIPLYKWRNDDEVEGEVAREFIRSKCLTEVFYEPGEPQEKTARARMVNALENIRQEDSLEGMEYFGLKTELATESTRQYGLDFDRRNLLIEYLLPTYASAVASSAVDSMLDEATLHWLAKFPEDLTPGRKSHQDQSQRLDSYVYPSDAPYDEEEICNVLLDPDLQSSRMTLERRNAIVGATIGAIRQGNIVRVRILLGLLGAEVVQWFHWLLREKIGSILASAYKARKAYIRALEDQETWLIELHVASFMWDVNEALPTDLFTVYPRYLPYSIYTSEPPIEPSVVFHWEYPVLDVSKQKEKTSWFTTLPPGAFIEAEDVLDIPLEHHRHTNISASGRRQTQNFTFAATHTTRPQLLNFENLPSFLNDNSGLGIYTIDEEASGDSSFITYSFDNPDDESSDLPELAVPVAQGGAGTSRNELAIWRPYRDMSGMGVFSIVYLLQIWGWYITLVVIHQSDPAYPMLQWKNSRSWTTLEYMFSISEFVVVTSSTHYKNSSYLLSFMSKVSAEEMYHTLERLTDNTGTKVPSSRIREFRRMIRFGHELDGVDAAAAGDLAIKCPACPHPDINLPSNWTKTSQEKSWVYKLFTAMDGNMKQVRLNASSEARDPGFNVGRAFFLDPVAHRNHVEQFDKRFPPQRSTCNDYKAVSGAVERGREHNCTVSGIFSVFCAWHDTFRPQGTTDLRYNERHVDVDFAYLSQLRYDAPKIICSSYDVMCQYSVNLTMRVESYPADLHAPHVFGDTQYVVPKFHLPSHVKECHTEFSFNYTPAPAKPMAKHRNAVGGRWDTLDDHLCDWNWRKSITLVSYLLDRGDEVLKKREPVILAFQEMCEQLDKETVAVWRRSVEAWEADSSKPNPLVSTIRPLSYHSVRLKLAKKDELRAQSGSQVVSREVSPVQMIVEGLELEEQQRRLRWDAGQLGQHATLLQQAKIKERATALARRVGAWTAIQQFHLPAATILRSRRASANTVLDGAECPRHLLEIEWELRQGLALDVLETLRQQLLSRAAVLDYKRVHTHGQYQGSRSATVLASLAAKIGACAARYRTHQAVLIPFFKRFKMRTFGVLTGKQWTPKPRITPPGHGFGLNAGVKATNENSIAESLRIGWCKARAKAHRWQEEGLLIQEEMRRVVEFLSHETVKWEQRGIAAGDVHSSRLLPGEPGHIEDSAEIAQGG